MEEQLTDWVGERIAAGLPLQGDAEVEDEIHSSPSQSLL